MILFTTFFTTLALLFQSLLASIGVILALGVFLLCLVSFVASAIASLFDTQAES